MSSLFDPTYPHQIIPMYPHYKLPTPFENYEISPILLVQFPHVSYFLRVSSI